VAKVTPPRAARARGPCVLVIGDDAELGALVALNLRLRGLLVEQTALALARSARWAPAFGRPDLVVVDLESAERVAPAHLCQALARPWARGVPVVLAADPAGRLAAALGGDCVVVARPTDVGQIVAAVRSLLGAAGLGDAEAR
jgi:DNA-binding response OmpR family regulator